MFYRGYTVKQAGAFFDIISQEEGKQAVTVHATVRGEAEAREWIDAQKKNN